MMANATNSMKLTELTREKDKTEKELEEKNGTVGLSQ